MICDSRRPPGGVDRRRRGWARKQPPRRHRGRGAPARVARANNGGGRWSPLQRVEALRLGRAPMPGGVRAAQPGRRGGDVRAAVDGAAVPPRARVTAARYGRVHDAMTQYPRSRRRSVDASRTPGPDARARLDRQAEPLLLWHGEGLRLLLPHDGEDLQDVAEIRPQRVTAAEELVRTNRPGPMGRPARARHARGGRAGGRPGGPRLRGPRAEAPRNGRVHDAHEDRRRPLQAKALRSTRAGPAGPGAGLEDELDPAVRREAMGDSPGPTFAALKRRSQASLVLIKSCPKQVLSQASRGWERQRRSCPSKASVVYAECGDARWSPCPRVLRARVRACVGGCACVRACVSVRVCVRVPARACVRVC